MQGTIKNWALVNYDGLCVTGEVTGHATLPDGAITTSRVISFDSDNKTIYTKSGSVYKIDGKPASINQEASVLDQFPSPHDSAADTGLHLEVI